MTKPDFAAMALSMCRRYCGQEHNIALRSDIAQALRDAFTQGRAVGRAKGLERVAERASDKDSLILCIASAWLHGTISRGGAAELAKTLGVAFSVVENLKFREEAELEVNHD